MDANKMIEKLEEFCKKGELDAFAQESSPEMDMPVLLVFLGMDGLERERVAQITVVQQEMGETLGGGPKEGESFFTISFVVPMPYEIHDDAHSDLCSTICFVNSNAILPGFEYHETEDRLLFRHVLMAREDCVTETQILSILGLIIFHLDLYAEMIGEVAVAKMSFEELVKQVAHFAEKLTVGDFTLNE